MYFGRAEGVAVARGKFIGDDIVEDALNVLEVGHVAGRADDSGVANSVQTCDILETSEGAVGRYEEGSYGSDQ